MSTFPPKKLFEIYTPKSSLSKKLKLDETTNFKGSHDLSHYQLKYERVNFDKKEDDFDTAGFQFFNPMKQKRCSSLLSTETSHIQDEISLELEGAVVQRSVQFTLPAVASNILSLEEKQLKELDYYEKLNQQTSEELQQLEKEVQTLSAEEYRLRQRLSRAKASNAESSIIIDQKTEEIQKLLLKKQKLQQEVDDYNTMVAGEEALYGLQVERIEELKVKITEHDRKAGWTKDLDMKQDELEAFKIKKQELEEELAELDKEDLSEEKLKELQKELDGQDEEVDKLHQRVNELHELQAKCRQEIDLSQKKHAAKVLRAKRQLQEIQARNQFWIDRAAELENEVLQKQSTIETKEVSEKPDCDLMKNQI